MDKTLYTEETINTRPTGMFIQEQIQDLRENVDCLETDREEMLLLLYEISDAETIEDIDEIIIRVKTFIETRPFPAPY